MVVAGERKPVLDSFRFSCHPGVSCYLVCCHKVEMFLYPVDVIRLKNRLGITSEEFMYKHARIAPGSHPFFPSVMLNMADKDGYPCPFLSSSGCSVYRDRPSACRTYPLERGVEYSPEKGVKGLYFLVEHSYCRGHQEDKEYKIEEWEREQGLHEYNLLNDAWAELDAFFATNPWQGEGVGGPKQQLAFMVCYNIDSFRTYIKQNNLLASFKIAKDEKKRIKRDDIELLKFGFSWLRFVLGGKSDLSLR